MSWADIRNQANNSNGGSSGSGVKYVKLENGTTQLRVVGEQPYSRWTHWIPQANDGKGFGIDCIGKGCPICAKMKEDKQAGRKTKYSSRKVHSIDVIQRVQGQPPEVSILDQGNKVFNGLLVLMEQMGDLRNYDVKIIRTGTGFTDTDYNVLPTFPPTPLTDEEKALPLYTDEQRKKIFTLDQINRLISGAKLEDVFSDEGSSSDDSEVTPVPDTTQQPNVDFTQRV